jgi:hypothetical protein
MLMYFEVCGCILEYVDLSMATFLNNLHLAYLIQFKQMLTNGLVDQAKVSNSSGMPPSAQL